MPNRLWALLKRINSIIYCKNPNSQNQILALASISEIFSQTEKNWTLQKNSRDKDVKYMNLLFWTTSHFTAEKNLKFKFKFLSALAFLPDSSCFLTSISLNLIF